MYMPSVSSLSGLSLLINHEGEIAIEYRLALKKLFPCRNDADLFPSFLLSADFLLLLLLLLLLLSLGLL